MQMNETSDYLIYNLSIVRLSIGMNDTRDERVIERLNGKKTRDICICIDYSWSFVVPIINSWNLLLILSFFYYFYSLGIKNNLYSENFSIFSSCRFIF